MFNAANRNAPDPQVGVQHRNVAYGVPERAQQYRPLALYDDIHGEPPDVEVERDEVVDVVHRPRCESGAHIGVSLPAGDDFAPSLGRQRIRIGRGLVPSIP